MLKLHCNITTAPIKRFTDFGYKFYRIIQLKLNFSDGGGDGVTIIISVTVQPCPPTRSHLRYDLGTKIVAKPYPRYDLAMKITCQIIPWV